MKIFIATAMRLYTSELVKKYKSRTVVNHVSIDVNQGEIVGLLGPNGAGKTTTFYMIVGLIKPNEGRIFLENDNQEITEPTRPLYISYAVFCLKKKIFILSEAYYYYMNIANTNKYLTTRYCNLFHIDLVNKRTKQARNGTLM